MPFRNSKFADWFMYALHDKNYLASKYMIKKYHYCKEDFYYSDETFFQELIHTSDFTKYKAQQLFVEFVHAGYSFAQILEKGVVPMNLVCQFKTMYNEIAFQERVKDVIDTNSGEVLSDVFKR